MQLNEALEILDEIAFYLELKEENIFKINAFRNAIRNLSSLNISLEEGLKSGTIANTKGIGKSILSILNEINEKGYSTLLNDLQNEIPASLLELTKINGLGTKKIARLFKELKVYDLNSLELNCVNNNISNLTGFGLKTQEKILEEIKRIKQTKNQMLLSDALKIDAEFRKFIKNTLNDIELTITGELRRFCEIINQIDYLVDETDIKKIKLLKELKIIQEDDDKMTISFYDKNIFIWKTTKDNFYIKLFLTTGPSAFIEKHLSNNSPDKIYKSEKEIFIQHNLNYIPPELRDNEEAYNQNLSLIEPEDLKGIIHIHSVYSDGVNTLRELRDEAEKRGYEYILISDHSKSSFYANGLSFERILKQWDEINELNSEKKGCKILKGIECDILPDGTLDYDDETLSKFDCVIASVHSSFNQPSELMTKRICNALKNPFVKILGHSTGRLLLSRNGYKIELDEIIKVASENNKIIEINCDPHRMDLDWRFHQKAIKSGVKLCLSPDAHSIKGYDNLFLGVMLARKGGLQKQDIINTLSFDDFMKVLGKNV